METEFFSPDEVVLIKSYEGGKDNLAKFNESIQQTKNLVKAYKDLGQFFISYNNKDLFAKTYTKLGQILFDQKDFINAIEAFQTVVKIHPQYEKSYFNLGEAFHAIGNSKAALEAFEAAIKADSHDSDAYCGLGDGLCAFRKV